MRRTLSVAARAWRAGPRVSTAYSSLVAGGAVSRDEGQAALCDLLGELPLPMKEDPSNRSRGSPSAATDDGDSGDGGSGSKGMYIYGGVGCGKSMCMDLFFDVVLANPVAGYALPKRRVHFHEFMLDVHQRIHAFKQQHPRSDPIEPVASQLAMEVSLFCFDEFQVHDIADAVILRRLFERMIAAGVTFVATSNRAPSELYQGGLNRPLFLPFIALLQTELGVFDLGSREDYRRVSVEAGRRELQAEAAAAAAEAAAGGGGGIAGGVASASASVSASGGAAVHLKQGEKDVHAGGHGGGHEHDLEVEFETESGEVAQHHQHQQHQRAYISPMDEAGRAAMEKAYRFATRGSDQLAAATTGSATGSSVVVPVAMGRTFEIPRSAGGVAWFPFDSLCGTPVGAADYLAVCANFHTIFVADVPQLDSTSHNQARRFITAIDIMYEAKVRVIIGAEVPIDALFVEDDQGRGGEGGGGTSMTRSRDSDSDSDIDSDSETASGGNGDDHDNLDNLGGDGKRSSDVESDGGFGLVSPPAILQGDRSRGIAADGGLVPEGAATHVSGAGGSSGRSTTMIGGLEWSATGRVGVSLAEMSAVADVKFAFARATSRLYEMNSPAWRDKTSRVGRVVEEEATM